MPRSGAGVHRRTYSSQFRSCHGESGRYDMHSEDGACYGAIVLVGVLNKSLSACVRGHIQDDVTTRVSNLAKFVVRLVCHRRTSNSYYQLRLTAPHQCILFQAAILLMRQVQVEPAPASLDSMSNGRSAFKV